MMSKSQRSNSDPNILLRMSNPNNTTENLDALINSALKSTNSQSGLEPIYPPEIFNRLTANLNLHPIKLTNSKRPISELANDFMQVDYPPPLC